MKPAASIARRLAMEGALRATTLSGRSERRPTRWASRHRAWCNRRRCQSDRARRRGRRCRSDRCRPPLRFRQRSKKEGPRDAQQRAGWTRGRNTRWAHGQRTSRATRGRNTRWTHGQRTSRATRQEHPLGARPEDKPPAFARRSVAERPERSPGLRMAPGWTRNRARKARRSIRVWPVVHSWQHRRARLDAGHGGRQCVTG